MKRALFAALALATLFAPLALAADRYQPSSDYRNDSRNNRYEDRRHDRDHRRDNHRRDDRDGYRADRYRHRGQHAPRYSTHTRQTSKHYSYSRYRAPRYIAPSHYRNHYQPRHWQRGHYLPAPYRARSYVIDHRSYRLPPPPRGYGYVRVDDDAVLVALASGLIADVLFDTFYR